MVFLIGNTQLMYQFLIEQVHTSKILTIINLSL